MGATWMNLGKGGQSRPIVTKLQFVDKDEWFWVDEQAGTFYCRTLVV